MNPEAFFWRNVAIGLLLALMAVGGLSGWKLISAYERLQDKTESLMVSEVNNETLRGKLEVQNEKVSSLGRETESAQTRYKSAIAAANTKDASNRKLSDALAKSVVGSGCKDAMGVVDEVLKATR